MDSNKKEKKSTDYLKWTAIEEICGKKKTVEIWELNGPTLRIHEHTDSLAKKRYNSEYARCNIFFLNM